MQTTKKKGVLNPVLGFSIFEIFNPAKVVLSFGFVLPSNRKEENITNSEISHVAHRMPTRPGRGRSRLTARRC